MQVLVVFTHGQLIALRDVVEAHGDFYQHAIQGEKNIELLLGLVPESGASCNLRVLVLLSCGIGFMVRRFRGDR